MGPKSTKETATAGDGGAESGAPIAFGAIADPTLAEVVQAWPTLPEPIKAGALALIRAADGRK